MALVISNRDLPFVRILDSHGDGVGSKNAIGDFSRVPGVFQLKPAKNETLSLISLTVSIITTELNLYYYNPGKLLDKGIQISLTNDEDSLVTFPKIYRLMDWASIASDWKKDDTFFIATIDFPKLFGKSVMIYGAQSEALRVEIFEEISLFSHKFISRGYYRDKR